MTDPNFKATRDEIEAMLDLRPAADLPVEGAASGIRTTRLAAELRLQGEIDRSLRRRFAIPPLPPLDLFHDSDGQQEGDAEGDPGRSDAHQHNPEDGSHTPSTASNRSTNGTRPNQRPSRAKSEPRATTSGSDLQFGPWLAAGIGAVLVVFASWWWLGSASRSSKENFTPPPLDEVYTEQAAEGWQVTRAFTPDLVRESGGCLPDIYNRQGVAIAPKSLPAGHRLVGMLPIEGVSYRSTALVAEVNGDKVLVIADKLSRDGKVPPIRAGAHLHMFRQELGALVLYEVSPFAEPTVLPYLVEVEPPDPCLDEHPELR